MAIFVPEQVEDSAAALSRFPRLSYLLSYQRRSGQLYWVMTEKSTLSQSHWKGAGETGRKPELLAPAGTLEVFETAVAAGADAVYIGAPFFNARELARHFTMAEVAAMIDHGHRHRVKVFLAMNSLVKEEELPQAVESLARLEPLEPDGLIIQDLGLFSSAEQPFSAASVCTPRP